LKIEGIYAIFFSMKSSLFQWRNEHVSHSQFLKEVQWVNQCQKTATIAHFAKKFDLKKKFVASLFEELAALSYKEAKNSFTLPGSGSLSLSIGRLASDGIRKTGRDDSDPGKDSGEVPRCKGLQGSSASAEETGACSVVLQGTARCQQ